MPAFYTESSVETALQARLPAGIWRLASHLSAQLPCAGMELRVGPAESESERALGRGIRHAVFVEEQGVPVELEIDGLDDQCRHFLAHLRLDGGGEQAVATARARVTDRGWKIERVAVLREQRGRSVGAALVRHMLGAAPRDRVVYIHAQQSAIGFWQRVGFAVEGPEFFEAGIPHRLMLWSRPLAS
ncbi:MAG TPA: GNAT family N-acetyltransferase [Polyangiaceae bacterium]|jgi:predicted GNAT family N-acyltransferase|nr:GNAT family N-acetyltransferase [Polyangiaceae bacterium]